MSDFELLESKVATLNLRLVKLEALVRANALASGDAAAAARVAEHLGFPVEVLVLPGSIEARKKLAARLRKEGWSAERIARVLHCSEKTIDRWMSGHANN